MNNENNNINKIRKEKREETQMIPKNIEGQSGLVQVDTTWGIIQPLQVRKDIQTVGELEVYEYQQNNFSIIDTRKLSTSGSITIPKSKNIPYDELVQRIDELDKNNPNIFFCNGPQCPQSPRGIKSLLEAGFPPDKILYYRGGIHDWITLGLTIKEI